VQGGLFPDLRAWCADELIKLDFDGYSVGGLAVDLETREMWDIVKQMGETLPENKQRYLMGVGTPDDIIKATHLGMDMFDCVLPTRMARHANVYVHKNCHPEGEKRPKDPKQRFFADTQNDNHYKLVNLLNSKYREDGGVIDENCGCPACSRPHFAGASQGKGYSRAYISHLLRSNEILGLRLATLHNLYTYIELMREFRAGEK
jgi:queuine tRNA-ribosyltransferase